MPHTEQTDLFASVDSNPADIGPNTTIAALAEEAAHCTRCHLYREATQTVFGAGPPDARVLLVGEQPGDQEDLAGAPFVGPAGKLLDRALEEAGVDRSTVYVTNAVKHFKFEPRGKRRIHQKPNASEVQACKFWLNLERALVRPKLVVALGATAATSLLGKTATISKLRGEPIQLEDGAWLMVTVHPSYLLRIPDPEAAAIERERFVDDLVRIKNLAQDLGLASIAPSSAA